MRLLISMYQGKPIAMLYEKSVEGVAPKDRVPFSSPWRTIYFDRVRALPDVKIAMAPIGGGFVVEAAIPRTSLNIPLQPGMKLKGDVGVLFADSGGTITISRQYWSNKATGLVNDIPGEADLIPRLWGQFELK
jgi:hypothetical protein